MVYVIAVRKDNAEQYIHFNKKPYSNVTFHYSFINATIFNTIHEAVQTYTTHIEYIRELANDISAKIYVKECRIEPTGNEVEIPNMFDF